MTTQVIPDANLPRLRGGRWWAEVGWKHVFAVLFVLTFVVLALSRMLIARLARGEGTRT